MIRTVVATLAISLCSCASQQTATLLPRGHDGERGVGQLDRMTNELTVTLEGRQYQGKMIMETSTSSAGFFGPTRTEISSRANAILVSASGQLRCEFVWDALMTAANGGCSDARNRTYDLLIRN